MILRRRTLLAGLTAIGALRGGALAQTDVPPVHLRRSLGMLVGGTEGSETARVARVFAGFLGPRLGAPMPGGVQVDVRCLPGESGHAMLTGLAEAFASGATTGWVVMPTLAARMIDHDDRGLIQRLQLIGQVEREPIAFVSPSSDPANSVQDIIKRAGDDSDAVPLGTPPAGSPPHLAALRLQVLAQTRLNIVTFPSAAAARQAVLAGNVSAAALGLSTVIGDVRDGNLTAIGIAAKRRFGLLPDAPILDEAGIPLAAFIRRGIAVPAATPGDIVATLADAVRAVAEDPAFSQQAEDNGYYAAWADAAAWRAQIDTEQAALAKLWETDPWLSSSGG
nr:tripartite tricarboxylate transporter substrate-binding protein [uncultured Rhodopila sp.]